MPVDIQVIELIPYPDRIQVGIKVDDHVAQHIRSAGIARKIRKLLNGVRQHQPMTIGQWRDIMVKTPEVSRCSSRQPTWR